MVYIVLVLGIIWLIYGIYQSILFRDLQINGKTVEGTIYDVYNKVNKFPEGGKEITYFMSVGFLTTKQALIVKEIDVTINYHQYKKGDIISIIYDENVPEIILVDEGKSAVYTYFLWLFPGAMFITIGIWMFMMK